MIRKGLVSLPFYYNIEGGENMSPEELFYENMDIAEKTLHKTFNNPHNLAKSKRMEYTDLLQYALTGLWIACKNYDSEKSQFETHAINNVKWHLFTKLRDDDNYKIYKYKPDSEENKVKMEWMDNYISDDNDVTFHEIIPSNVNVYEDAHDNIVAPKYLENLSDRQKEVVLLKAEGYNCQEIGNILGMTRENARQLLLRSGRRTTKIRNKLEVK